MARRGRAREYALDLSYFPYRRMPHDFQQFYVFCWLEMKRSPSSQKSFCSLLAARCSLSCFNCRVTRLRCIFGCMPFCPFFSMTDYLSLHPLCRDSAHIFKNFPSYSFSHRSRSRDFDSDKGHIYDFQNSLCSHIRETTDLIQGCARMQV